MLNLADFTQAQSLLAALSVFAPASLLAPLQQWVAANAPVPVVQTFPLDPTNIVSDWLQYDSSRYERWQRPLILTATPISIKIHALNQANGGSYNALRFPRYEWEIDGQVRASATVPAGALSVFLTGTLADEPDGLAMFSLIGVGADGGRVEIMRHGGYIRRTTDPWPDKEVWQQSGSRAWEVIGSTGRTPDFTYVRTPVPVAQSTRVKPLVPRLGQPFQTVHIDFTKVNLVPPEAGVPSQPLYRMKCGVLVSEGRERYEKADTTSTFALIPRKDGPRGVGTVGIPLALLAGRRGPYGADHRSVWAVDWTGYVRTLFGNVHMGDLPHWTECKDGDDGTTLVGDWSEVPANLRSVQECWGLTWLGWSLPIDRTKIVTDALTPPPGEARHVVGPRICASSRGVGILEAEFSPVDHMVPAKVRLRYPGSDFWGLAEHNGILYAADRRQDRLIMLDTRKIDASGYYTLVGTFAGTQSLNLGNYATRFKFMPNPGVTLAQLRAPPVVGPEGLKVRVLGGVPYAYWSSKAQGEIRRQAIAGNGFATGPIETVAQPYLDNNSGFVMFDVSPEGSFFPPGTVWSTTWSVTNAGRPECFVPGRGKVVWNGYSPAIIQGPGGKWDTAGYGSAVAVGGGDGTPENPAYGALFCSSSSGGIEMFRLREADEAIPDYPTYQAISKGAGEYGAKDRVLHGANCNGPDIPLPWGESAAKDAFMAHCGYAP